MATSLKQLCIKTTIESNLSAAAEDVGARLASEIAEVRRHPHVFTELVDEIFGLLGIINMDHKKIWSFDIKPSEAEHRRAARILEEFAEVLEKACEFTEASDEVDAFAIIENLPYDDDAPENVCDWWPYLAVVGADELERKLRPVINGLWVQLDHLAEIEPELFGDIDMSYD